MNCLEILPFRPIEAVYLFPTEESAAVLDFQAELDGRKVTVSVKEKEEAAREYKQAKIKGKTAFLLEEVKHDVFKAIEAVKCIIDRILNFEYGFSIVLKRLIPLSLTRVASCDCSARLFAY